jgi:hypothetical protein
VDDAGHEERADHDLRVATQGCRHAASLGLRT